MSKSDDIKRILYAKAYDVNTRYKVRALFNRLDDIPAMEKTWRDRLREALTASDRSMRSVSLAADCGPSYLYEVLEVGKEPTIDRLARVAGALDLSLSWLLFGSDIGVQEEELLRLFASLSDKQRRALLDLASGVQ